MPTKLKRPWHNLTFKKVYDRDFTEEFECVQYPDLTIRVHRLIVRIKDFTEGRRTNTQWFVGTQQFENIKTAYNALMKRKARRVRRAR